MFKKSIYEIVCKNAKSGKEAYTMLQEYVSGVIYDKIFTPDSDDFDLCENIFRNIFADCEKIKVRNIKEVDNAINELINKEIENMKK